MFCFPLPGETRYRRLRSPSRLKMNSLCSALTAVLARQTIQLSGKRETKHHEFAQITVKILDSKRPSHGSPWLAYVLRAFTIRSNKLDSVFCLVM